MRRKATMAGESFFFRLGPQLGLVWVVWAVALWLVRATTQSKENCGRVARGLGVRVEKLLAARGGGACFVPATQQGDLRSRTGSLERRRWVGWTVAHAQQHRCLLACCCCCCCKAQRNKWMTTSGPKGGREKRRSETTAKEGKTTRNR